MKIRRSAAAAVALAGTGTLAQGVYGTSSSSSVSSPSSLMMMSSSTNSSSNSATMTTTPSTSYTTITYSDCPTSSMASMITVTNGITVTYCPECQMMGESSSATVQQFPGYTTVYTTTYLAMCSTGTMQSTYTVTESCTEATPTWTAGPSHIPQGFTVTVAECTVCGETPMTLTITEPCGCEANEGTPAPAPTPNNNPAVSSNTPAQTTPASGNAGSSPAPSGSAICEYVDGQPQANCQSSGSNAAPSGGTSLAPGASTVGSNITALASPLPARPAGSPTTITTMCPGPQCQATPGSGSSTPEVQHGNSAAALKSFGLVSCLFTVFAGLAFML